MNNFPHIKLTFVASNNRPSPHWVGNTTDILTYGGVSVAVILALSIFLLAMNKYQKSQLNSLTKLIKTLKDNK